MIDINAIRRQLLTGTFVFADAGDGCMPSKYTNNHAGRTMVESCKLREGTSKGAQFTGDFDSVWLEGESTPQTNHILEIERRGEEYFLQWTRDGSLRYVGVGMLYQGLLVGAYWIPN
jgi:hypothetical protein